MERTETVMVALTMWGRPGTPASTTVWVSASSVGDVCAKTQYGCELTGNDERRGIGVVRRSTEKSGVVGSDEETDEKEREDEDESDTPEGHPARLKAAS